MAIDADHFNSRQAGCLAVHRDGLVVRDAELVLLEASGYVRVCLGIHIGIDAQRHAGCLAHLARNLGQPVEFALGFDVEAQNADLQRGAHFIAGLAHAGKNHFARISTGSDHSREFSCRDDVESCAHLGKQTQDGQVRVGFHRVTDQHIPAGAWLGERPVRRFQRGTGIDVTRRSVPAGNRLEGYGFGVQHAIAACKRGHDWL